MLRLRRIALPFCLSAPSFLPGFKDLVSQREPHRGERVVRAKRAYSNPFVFFAEHQENVYECKFIGGSDSESSAV